MLVKISHQEAFENLSDKERRHKVYYKDVANGFYGKAIAEQMRTSTERVKELVKGVKRKDEKLTTS